MKKGLSGFSLIELILVIIIIGIITSGSLKIYDTMKELSAIEVTKERIKIIDKSIMNYIKNNGSLPCPSKLFDVASSDAGTEYTTSNQCHNDIKDSTGDLCYGALPYKDLNLADTIALDGWNNKIKYVINCNAKSSLISFNEINSVKSAFVKGNVRHYTSFSYIIFSDGFNQYNSVNQHGDFFAMPATEVANRSNITDWESFNNWKNNNGVKRESYFAIRKTGANFDDIIHYKDDLTVSRELNNYIHQSVCKGLIDPTTNNDASFCQLKGILNYCDQVYKQVKQLCNN